MRFTIMFVIGGLLVGLLSLLVWGSVKSGGVPGGYLTNNTLGEVSVRMETAPDFTVETLSRDSFVLSQHVGKVVVVNFWASWCPPCRKEAAAFKTIYSEYQGYPVEFLGVDVWDREREANEYIKLYDITYPNVLDLDGRIAIDYGVMGIPETYLIDMNGKLKRKFVGPLSEDRLRKVLQEMLVR